jgi:hypothetical protein
MKKLFIIALLILPFLSCKKTKENIAQDLVIEAMTNGQWVITKFTLNGSNITADFSPYKFQYYSNKTVDAIKNGSTEKTGNWDGNATDMTTWANFLNVSYPLNLINGTWHITNNSWTFVEASQTSGTDVKTLRLDKLP